MKNKLFSLLLAGVTIGITAQQPTKTELLTHLKSVKTEIEAHLKESKTMEQDSLVSYRSLLAWRSIDKVFSVLPEK